MRSFLFFRVEKWTMEVHSLSFEVVNGPKKKSWDTWNNVKQVKVYFILSYSWLIKTKLHKMWFHWLHKFYYIFYWVIRHTLTVNLGSKCVQKKRIAILIHYPSGYYTNNSLLWLILHMQFALLTFMLKTSVLYHFKVSVRSKNKEMSVYIFCCSFK